MHVYGQIIGRLTDSGHRLTGRLTIPQGVAAETYDGPYEFTPTADTQTIEIEQKMATADIIINPIPSNWGLITWNGSVLTVS
jgi:hypothetical protein